MISESLARRYAVALYNLVNERNELQDVYDEFQLIDDVLRQENKFRYFLYSPKINREEKKQILTQIFKDRISKSMLHFMFLLLDKKRQTLLDKIFSHFATLYDNHVGRATITVRPAVKIEKAMLDEIKTDFEKQLEKQVVIEEEVDPTLIGGLQVRINNTVYDASILNKLQNIRKQLV